jgi:hypothetical protein
MNLAASDYSEADAKKPDRFTISIQHKGDALKYRVDREKDGKKDRFEVDLNIGGSPFESDAAGVVSAEWKGDRLEVQTLYNPGQDRQSYQTETWSISAEGKLVDDVVIHPPRNGAAVHVRRVLDKAR